MLYEILKALHIVAVIAWMGGAALPAAPARLSRRRREGAWQSETFHNGVAWFLADVLTTRPVELRDALARESTAGDLHTNSL
jgi:hypothetical protein